MLGNLFENRDFDKGYVPTTPPTSDRCTPEFTADSMYAGATDGPECTGLQREGMANAVSSPPLARRGRSQTSATCPGSAQNSRANLKRLQQLLAIRRT